MKYKTGVEKRGARLSVNNQEIEYLFNLLTKEFKELTRSDEQLLNLTLRERLMKIYKEDNMRRPDSVFAISVIEKIE